MDSIISIPGRPLLAEINIAQFDFGHGNTVSDLGLISKNIADYIEHGEVIGSLLEDSSQWSGYLVHHRPHIEILRHGNGASLKTIMSHLFATPLTHGFAHSNFHYAILRDNPDQHIHMASLIIDKMTRLTDSLGISNVRSPEHGPFVQAAPDILASLDALEAVLGIDLTPPSADGALWGLQTSKGTFTERHFEAIYVAWQLSKMGCRSVIEIGGGAALTCYYARKFGIDRYTIIDLPSVSMVQYMILATSLGDAAVGIGGQSPTAPIQLIRAEDADTVDWAVDCVLNVDSFPEMPRVTASSYINLFSGASRKFLSINQESRTHGFTVGDLCVFPRLNRAPFWMRTGWVEETYDPLG